MSETTLIAIRESRLALWQAEHVRELLTQRFGMRVVLLGVTTTPRAPLLRAQVSGPAHDDAQARALGEHAARTPREAGAAAYLGAAGAAS